MVAAFARLDPQVDRIGAAVAEIDRRLLDGNARTIRADQRVGGKQQAMLGANLAQSRRAGLLAHLDQPFGVEAEPAARREHRPHGGDADGVLALVVGDAATVIAAVPFGERERGKPLRPAGLEPADDVAVTVAEHTGQIGGLDALRAKERPACLWVRQQPAAEAQRLERRHDLGVEIVLELAGTPGILALGRDRDPAREVGLEAAGIEIGFRKLDRGVPAHAVAVPPSYKWQATWPASCSTRGTSMRQRGPLSGQRG